jgi:glutamyl/glutaminyl-tRNA synthetase
LLGRKAPPAFLHHQLILREDGQKLSKSNHDTGLRDLRAKGFTVEQVLGRAAAALGLSDGAPKSMEDVTERIKAWNRR